MKILGFLFGVALGLVLMDFILQPPGNRAAAQPLATEGARPARDAKSTPAATSTASPAAASAASSPAPIPQPARTRPNAFFFATMLFGLDASRLSAEDAADPQFKELHARALRARATDRLAPMVLALGLNDSQFAVLLDVACDQSVAWSRSGSSGLSRDATEARGRELSAAAETRLAAVFSPAQLEQLAALRGFAHGWVASLDSFASRGAPLPGERLPSLIRPDTLSTPRGTFAFTYAAPPELTTPWLTDAQRRILARQQRWSEANELVHALRSTKVKDPELKDMWPPE